MEGGADQLNESRVEGFDGRDQGEVWVLRKVAVLIRDCALAGSRIVDAFRSFVPALALAGSFGRTLQGKDPLSG